VFPIQMPPLRARLEDIPLLVEYLIDRHAARLKKTIRSIAADTVARLQSYSWPGNVRELQNVVERSLVLADSDVFAVDESWFVAQPPDSASPHGDNAPLSDALAMREKAMIEAALAETRGRVAGPSGAAAKLRVNPATLESKIRSMGIDKRRFKTVY
jgi:formate hydrogenlyase transcriptional activator